MSKVKPNFFIVGAPKCGTTALSEYLREHDEIFVSTPKEPHYFATDMDEHRAFKDEKSYLEIFENAEKNYKVVGEASVYYLYSKEAIKNIHAFDENAKIIIMLRNPVEMVYSLHSQLIQSAHEDVLNFNTSWNLIKDRKAGKNLPKHSIDHQLLFYDEIAKYNEQLENVYKYFDNKQVKVILFDDFKLNTQKVYEETLDFLDVKRDNRTFFPVINENDIPRNHFINILIKKQPKWIKYPKNFIKSIFGIKEFGLAGIISKLNKKKVKRKELESDMKKLIYTNYKDSIDSLELILERKLEAWKAI